MKYLIILITIKLLCCLFADGSNAFPRIWTPSSPSLANRLLHNLLVTLLKKCDVNSEKIIIFDYTSSTITIIKDIHPQVSVSFFSDPVPLTLIRRSRLDDLDLDIVVLVIPVKDGWISMKNFFTKWRYNRNCIVYIIPNPINYCRHIWQTLEWVMRYYFSSAYFICASDKDHVHIHTHDPYGDSKPQYWMKSGQSQFWGKNWNFYKRTFNTIKADLNELCQGFNFNRTDPNNQTIIPLGIRQYQIRKHFVPGKYQYDSKIEKDLKSPHRDRIQLLKRLLKFQFQYFPVIRGSQSFATYGIDAIVCAQSFINESDSFDYFHPIEYGSFAIMSHNQGVMTPLEKIVNYYGVWTLSSLTVILIMAFMVIWYITRNLSSAFFNIIRLLINTGIIVPINNKSRKIFFCMVFLYFLVIHATLSGHLAKFLTKIEPRDNVETLEDLKSPRIKRIYNFGYKYDEAQKFDVLRNKTNYILITQQFENVINKTDHAYIAPLPVLDIVRSRIIHESNLYTSKNRFGFFLISSSFRPGFPLSEKFNWAFMYLYERFLIAYEHEGHREWVLDDMEKQKAAMDIHHRAIIMSDINFALILLIAGILISFISFFIEIGLSVFCTKSGNLWHNEIEILE